MTISSGDLFGVRSDGDGGNVFPVPARQSLEELLREERHEGTDEPQGSVQARVTDQRQTQHTVKDSYRNVTTVEGMSAAHMYIMYMYM